ncbi:carbohydrate porin [Ensifer sp. LC163]|uniref:carbohydrate porin n=1 Tax=Ensifer sp. LC163 TaxID=1120652 RepID=UPI00081313F9|nr:carbohydrate porin [Ensifer sp. LC163]OCP34877.1 hypothetical protein BC360_29630 [Ensifer sp. LC163]
MLDVIAKTPLMGGGGIDTFQNLAIAAPITGLTPPYLLGANLTVKTDPVVLNLLVYDPRNAQNEDVLKDPFSEGVTGMVSATVPVQISGLSGFYGVKVVYSNKEGIDLADIPFLLLPSESGQFVGTKKGSWFIGASFQQYLVQNPANPQEGWGVFGQFGVSDGNPNPLDWSAILGVGGTSFIRGRNLDRWGIGYFRYSFSNDLVGGLGTVGIGLRDEQGVEGFYNMAVTPWFRLTADLQVIAPGVEDASTAVLGSLRAQVKF